MEDKVVSLSPVQVKTTIFFGLFSKVGDFRTALFYASFLFIPAGLVAWWLPEPARDPESGELETPSDAPLAE